MGDEVAHGLVNGLLARRRGLHAIAPLHRINGADPYRLSHAMGKAARRQG
jgi:hypothetical protein